MAYTKQTAFRVPESPSFSSIAAERDADDNEVSIRQDGDWIRLTPEQATDLRNALTELLKEVGNG